MAPLSQLTQYPHLLSILLFLAAAVTLQQHVAAAADELQGRPHQGLGRPGCRDKCGGMSIPFPFGMDKPDCFLPGYEVTCNTSFTPPRAFLAYNYTGGPAAPNKAIYLCPFGNDTTSCNARPVELFDISLETSEVRVYAGATSRCFTNQTGGIAKGEYIELDREGPFLLSPRNELVGVGWSVTSSMSYQIKPYPDPLSCTANSPFRFPAQDALCSGGLGCCKIAVPPPWPTMPIIETAVDFDAGNFNSFWETSPCSYGMLVERSWYNFTADDLHGYEALSKRLARGFPLVLDFAIRNGSCERDGCLSGNSSCAKAAYDAEGYVCKCWEHYHGNPYITNGCQDIDECQLREQSPEFGNLYPCDGICTNTAGGYDCRCKRGMRGDAKKGNCTEIFPLPAKIIVG